MVKHILNAEEKAQITATVREAEVGHPGEIVPMLVWASDNYAGARWRLAVSVALLFGVGVSGLHPEWDPLLVPFFIAGLLLGHGLGCVPAILRLFVSRQEMQHEVRQLALQAFFENNLHETKDRTGILLLVSLLEHRVELIADKGIHAKVQQQRWNDIVGALVDDLRGGNRAAGLQKAIRACGDLLRQHFPPEQGKARNQLPDEPL